MSDPIADARAILAEAIRAKAALTTPLLEEAREILDGIQLSRLLEIRAALSDGSTYEAIGHVATILQNAKTAAGDEILRHERAVAYGL